MTEFINVNDVFVVVKTVNFTFITVEHVFASEPEAKKFVTQANKDAKQDNIDYPLYAKEIFYTYYKVPVKDSTLGFLKQTGQI